MGYENNYQKLLISEARHWDEFEKEFIEEKEIIPWWLDLQNASLYDKGGRVIFDPVRENLIRGKFKNKIINECIAGQSVLDIGCGSGWLSLELARKGCHVIAIDVSSYRVNLGKEYYEKIKKIEKFKGTINYISGDIHQIHIPDNIDTIVAWDALHHLPELNKLFFNLNKKLKPGGKLICYDHIGSIFIETLGKLRRLLIKEKISAFEDVSQDEIPYYINKYFTVREKKYKITTLFRLIDFVFFRYEFFKSLIPASVKIDEFLANTIALFGGEFIYIKAIKKLTNDIHLQ